MQKRRAELAQRKSKRIQYVYPEPGAENNPGVDHLQKIAQQVTKAVMRFCPYCGENIERHVK
jgi:hypothetical protein